MVELSQYTLLTSPAASDYCHFSLSPFKAYLQRHSCNSASQRSVVTSSDQSKHRLQDVIQKKPHAQAAGQDASGGGAVRGIHFDGEIFEAFPHPRYVQHVSCGGTSIDGIEALLDGRKLFENAMPEVSRLQSFAAAIEHWVGEATAKGSPEQ